MSKGKQEISAYLKRIPFVKNIINWSQKTAIPGFDNVPVYNVIAFVIKEAKRDSIVTRSESIAFSFFLSLFPFLIFLLPILSRTPVIENYLEVGRNSIQGVLPSSAEEYIFGIVNSIQLEGQTGWLTLGFFLAIFFSSSGMSTLMTGFDKSYNTVFKSRGYFKQRFIAILLTLLLSTLLVLSIALIVLGQQFLGFLVSNLGLDTSMKSLFGILRWLIMIILYYSIITSIYRFGPSMYKKIKFLSPGATLATLLSILSSVAFSYFVNTFDRYNQVYGSVGALIVILLWLEINAFILLVGFELNASIAVHKGLRNIPPKQKRL